MYGQAVAGRLRMRYRRLDREVVWPGETGGGGGVMSGVGCVMLEQAGLRMLAEGIQLP